MNFSYNASSQYKSKIQFDTLSKSDVPIMRSFLGEKHGKSTADGVISRHNQFLSLAVRNQFLSLAVRNSNVLSNAEELAEFCTNQLTKKLKGACQHFWQDFFYTEHSDLAEYCTRELTNNL